MGANERTIREFLSDKYGSHIISLSQRGLNGADNIALFEMSIAMPIIQSLLRHSQAGGFSEEAADAYKNTFSGSALA